MRKKAVGRGCGQEDCGLIPCSWVVKGCILHQGVDRGGSTEGYQLWGDAGAKGRGGFSLFMTIDIHTQQSIASRCLIAAFTDMLWALERQGEE